MHFVLLLPACLPERRRGEEVGKREKDVWKSVDNVKATQARRDASANSPPELTACLPSPFQVLKVNVVGGETSPPS